LEDVLMAGPALADATVGCRPAAPGQGAVRALRRLGAWALSPRAIPLALGLLTFAVFLPALWNQFVEWDDYINLFDNPRYRGLRWPNLRWMFSSVLMGHYIPITWLTFGLDFTLWGMNPLGYHLTNNLLHAANAALFYLVALRLLAAATSLAGPPLRLAAGMAALFFALHPLRAESVAWATERRDVLSGFFFLLTLLAYLAAAHTPGPRRRWLLAASAAAYLLALGSKSIVMTLPLVLLLLDLYPLRRLPCRWQLWARPPARAVLLEKIPYFALAIAAAVTAYCVVWLNAFLTSLDRYPRPARLGITAYSLWFYLSKTLVPIWLSPLYELPAKVNLLEPRFALSAVAVVALSAIALALARRWPAGLAVWAYYGIVLGPVTGLVHSGHQLAHDRYSYLSCLGFALLIGAAAGCLARAQAHGALRPWLARVAGAVMALWIVVLGALTWNQVQIWRDTDTLWRYAVESDPGCSICQNNLGISYLKQRLFDRAKERFDLALDLRPDRARPRQNLGVALASMGDNAGAIEQLTKVLAKLPDDPDVLSNLGGVLIADNRESEGLARIHRALRIKPDHVAALTNLGSVLVRTGHPEIAVGHLRRAVSLNPDYAPARLHLARAYSALGRLLEARAEQHVARGLDPVLAREAHGDVLTSW
jgi:Flp pilus assembly protein TadD